MTPISAINPLAPPSFHVALLVVGEVDGEAIDDAVDNSVLEEAVSEVVDGVPEEEFAQVGDEVADDADESVDEGVGTAVATSELELAHLAFSFSTAPSLSSTVFVAFSFSGYHISWILKCANLPPCSPRVHLSSSVM